MADQIRANEVLVGTRKGLFTLARGASGHDVSDVAFLGVPVSAVLRDPRDGTTYAALDHGHFGTKLLWTLEAGHADAPGRIWAGTIPGGLFRSDDRGDTWALDRALWDDPSRTTWTGGGYDYPGVHSVCTDPRDAE